MAPSYILVTGATGFVGAHVVDSLLRRGLRVRATMRSHSKDTAERMLAARPGALLDFIEIGSMTEPGAFDAALSGGIDGVIHCASPCRLDFTDNEREAIIPAIAGVTSMLDSIAKTPSITRLVLTSSMAAVYNPYIKEYPPGFVYTASDWSPVTREEGIAGDSMTGYRAGKKLAEQAAWEFIETHKPHFDLATMLEPMVFGPPAHAMLSMRDLNASNTPLWPVANGTYPEQRQWAPQCVDVRDVAEAHAEALLRPEAGGKRYILAGPRWTFKEVSEILWRNFEWAKERVKPLEGGDNKAFFVIDGETAAKELGFQYASLEKTIVDTFRAWIEIDEKERSG